ncbi:NAD(P)-dependent oxidoreductase [Streptomyces violaceusniger]|uniref:NAD(P)-dependent oxidoreductase n=2 Tax=Streptomyces violaceusniger TaxID=68280 RepID=UPI0009974F8E
MTRGRESRMRHRCDAVGDVLDTRHLPGAGFDVFPAGPVPVGSRLLSAPGVVLTSHIGAMSA